MEREEKKEQDLITALEDAKYDKQFEKNADQLEEQLGITQEGKEKTGSTIYSFLKSYIKKPKDMDNAIWLTNEFNKYPQLWDDSEESQNTANEIVETINDFEKAKQDFAEHQAQGKSKESWIGKRLEETASISGSLAVGEYAGQIENALKTANDANLKQIYTQSGNINLQRNLDGFLAEQQHANTFNLDAIAKNKPYRAEVLGGEGGFGKNSVDIVIKDTQSGKIVRRYQAKYGKDSKATNDLFNHGDYKGQRKLVPKGQGKDIQGSTEVIEIDGCSSKAMSKAEAKKWQKSAQENEYRARTKRYKWDAIDKVQVAKEIGKQAGIAAVFAVGMQGARIVGRRIWNSLTGKKNQSVEKDVQEFVQSSIVSGGSAGLVTAVTGGVTVAVKSGWLGVAAKSFTKGNVIASTVCMGIENIKTLYRYGKGEINGKQTIDAMANTAITTYCGYKYAIAGGVYGFSVAGPVGGVIGGIVGGFVGTVAGSTVGKAIYEGGKKIAKTVWNGVKKVGSAIKDGVKSFWNSLFG